MAKNSGTRWAMGGLAIGLAAVAVGLATTFRPAPTYERLRLDDPESLIDIAWGFVENGRADRLPELVQPESPQMESVLARLGSLLASAQELASAVTARFPEEVASIRADAESVPLGAFTDRGGPDNASLGRLLADPFGWLDSARQRVQIVYVADDVRAVLVDGRPAFGVGLTLRRFDDGWRIVLPTAIPGLGNYMPHSNEEWQVVASMVTVVDRALRDLAAEVRSGGARTIEDTARRAGEMAWGPLVMTVIAYQKAREARIGERGAGNDL